MELTADQELWLQALESGNYKQGRHRLRVGDSFCCLGVGCDIFEVPHTIEASNMYNYDGLTSVAPDCLVKRLKLNAPNAPYGIGRSLVRMNDDGKTFLEIAKFVRANPEKVFHV